MHCRGISYITSPDEHTRRDGLSESANKVNKVDVEGVVDCQFWTSANDTIA